MKFRRRGCTCKCTMDAEEDRNLERVDKGRSLERSDVSLPMLALDCVSFRALRAGTQVRGDRSVMI